MRTGHGEVSYYSTTVCKVSTRESNPEDRGNWEAELSWSLSSGVLLWVRISLLLY